MNPLLEQSVLEFEAIDFRKIKTEHYLPALNQAIEMAKENMDKIKKESAPSFDSVILAGETASDQLDSVVEIFYALHSAHCTDELEAIAEEFNQKLTEYSSDISLDAQLFSKTKEVYDSRDSLSLSLEQQTVLENTYKSFTRNGALLSDDDKEILRDIDQKMSVLNLKFSENVRKATNAFSLEINNEDDLVGMPEGVLEAAKMKATEKSSSGWIFTLDYPSYGPFMQYCQNRELREQMWKASSTRGIKGEFDNLEVIKEILSNREKRAQLLGYGNHADYVLENRMAKNPQTVLNFLTEILEKAEPQAKNDFKKLSQLKEQLCGDGELRKFDSTMYSEILKKQELDFDDEVLRPYFKLENVVAGVFEIATKLYGLQFQKREDLPGYHADVDVFEVRSENEDFIGLFYTDFFPRKEKNPGAWMTTFRNAGFQFGEVKRPFVSIVCNFTKPTDTKPSLLSLNEVLTLFHEFGHGLHGLLAKSNYKSVAGTNVFWDFVELPSQIMENWVLEKECLDMFAKHFETGENIPKDLVSKIKNSQTFLEGMATMRQLSFAYLDMSWHTTKADSIEDVLSFEKAIMEKFDLYPQENVGAMSPAFGHIFSGGYAAGYYSYKWAEVLDADAFAYFKEKGIFDPEVAKSFKENILEMGGSRDPMELYKSFRGQEPSSDALLKRGGLI